MRKMAHLFTIGNGADALDLISYSRFPTVHGVSSINSILLILFSMGVAQFCIDTLATKESKSSDLYIIVETDLWSSLVILFTNDLPYLAMRLFLMGKYQVCLVLLCFLFQNLRVKLLIFNQFSFSFWFIIQLYAFLSKPYIYPSLMY